MKCSSRQVVAAFNKLRSAFVGKVFQKKFRMRKTLENASKDRNKPGSLESCFDTIAVQTYLPHSVVSPRKTLYGVFLCMAVLERSSQLQLYW